MVDRDEKSRSPIFDDDAGFLESLIVNLRPYLQNGRFKMADGDEKLLCSFFDSNKSVFRVADYESSILFTKWPIQNGRRWQKTLHPDFLW